MPRTKIPNNVIRDVLTEAGYRCAVPTCRNILAIDMHHIIEVKDNGLNEASNLLALCPTCHALYTRGTISSESINAWKTMLVALNHAFDQESISNLLFLHQISKDVDTKMKGMKIATKNGEITAKSVKDLNLLVVSGDGVLKFSHLIASELAQFKFAASYGATVTYYVSLTDKGRRIINAWMSGTRNDVKEALSSLPE